MDAPKASPIAHPKNVAIDLDSSFDKLSVFSGSNYKLFWFS